MIGKKKAITFFSLLVNFLLFSVLAIAQISIDANKLQLANRYYNDKEFEKAAVLYKEIFDQSKSQHYFNYFLNCLIELNDFESAEKAIKQQYRRSRDANLLVQWGYLYKLQNRLQESTDKYSDAVKNSPPIKTGIATLANTFVSRREFEWAEKVYLQGRKILANETFHYELARIYHYQRNFERMLDEYLDMLKADDKTITRVQSGIRSAFRADTQNSLPPIFTTILLKRIQATPDVIAYNRLLIWLFIQRQLYQQAFKQAVALDKRKGDEESTIMMVARSAANNQDWNSALEAYDYLLGKTLSGNLLLEARLGKMLLLVEQFEKKASGYLPAEKLENEFSQTFQELGYRIETANMIVAFAHFLAFYRDKADDALLLLEEGMKIPKLPAAFRTKMKNEKGDIFVYKGDQWEAVLIYSQVIEENRNNSLGDEVKLKKARLAYYMGNMSWAQAQLDVIKASTSKLVANDALELSIFISNNTSLDTTEVPMQMFARADLHLFRNQAEKAELVLDSILNQYSYHSLLDDVYLRKAKLKVMQGQHEGAATYLEKIVSDYSYDLLADDAHFLLAEVKEQHLLQVEEASELYKKILVQYPGSVHVVEARKRYRKLRGDDIE